MKSILCTLVLAAAAFVSFSGSAQACDYGYGGYGYGYNTYCTPVYTRVYRPVYVQPVYPSYNYGYSAGYGG